MSSIYVYLLKDIANIVLDYVYKPDIKKLNREYLNQVNYIIVDDYECLEFKEKYWKIILLSTSS